MSNSAVISIFSREVLDDIRSAAWLESEIHPECNRHRRHEMADICEPCNVERVWRILDICDAEVRMALRQVILADRAGDQLNELNEIGCRFYILRDPPTQNVVGFLKEKIHEYFVASVMADRTAVIIPESLPPWEERKKEALAAITAYASTASLYALHFRPLSPL